MILVIGLSTRMLVKSLSNSHDVFAIDVFGDLDTLETACGWRSIGNANYLIDETRFLKVFKNVVKEYSPTAFIHSSGFEGKYHLIEKAEKTLPHYGLPVKRIKKVRDSAIFFKMLSKLKVNYPETIVKGFGVKCPRGWLRKSFDTAAGSGITKKNDSNLNSQSIYLQKEISGKPMSVFFLAGREKIKVFGFCENLYINKNSSPYYFAGLIGPIQICNRLISKIFEIIKKISNEFNLIGLNGLDFILMSEKIYVLEVNPRPTAAMEIFENFFRCSLLDLHCDVFSRPFKPKKLREIKFFEKISFAKKIYGTRIIFAEKDINLTQDFFRQLNGLSWCRDLPNVDSLKKGDPICSIMIEANSIKSVNLSLLKAKFSIEDLLRKI